MNTPAVKTCCPEDLKKKIADENICVIDVREPAEFKSEKINGTSNHPLSGFDKKLPDLSKNQGVILVCKSGARSERAAQKLAASGCSGIYVLEGGLDAWKTAGLPIEKNSSSVWALDRQVRLGAGLLVIAGLLLSHFAHPAWIGLSYFVALGLIFAAITNTCGMAMLLAKMPWNK